jgi:hypothetical protein
MASESAHLASLGNDDLQTLSAVPQPFWERSPRKFWSAHENLIELNLHEWRAADSNLSLSKAVSRYLDGLPSDIPADILLKITKMVVEAWEKKRAGHLIGV